MQKHKKLLAVVLCVSVVLTLFFSLLYIAEESNHECCGENCAVCLQLHNCAEALRALGMVLAVILAAYIIITHFSSYTGRFPEQGSLSTLVMLKVKLTA